MIDTSNTINLVWRIGAMRQLIILFLFAITSLSFTKIAYSETTENLTLKQAILNVLEHSPVLQAATVESLAATERIKSAIQSPSYHGTIELENFAGSGLRSGNKTLETTLSLSKVLELGDKESLRGDIYRHNATLLKNKQDSQRLDLLAETANRFIDIVTDQQRLINANESINVVNRTRQVVEKRVKAGKSPTTELRRVEIALERAKLTLKHAEHKLDNGRLKLATLWGDTKVSFINADANLFDIKQVSSFKKLAALLENNPDLILLSSEKKLTQSKILLAKSAAKLDLELSGGIRHFKATDDTALVLSLNIPFGSASRATPKINEAEILESREPYIFKQKKLVLYATLFQLYNEVTHAVTAFTSLRETIIPQAEQALKDYEKGYAAGRYSFFELSEAQRLLLDLKLELVVTASDYHNYQIEIDRLTGARMPIGNPQ